MRVSSYRNEQGYFYVLSMPEAEYNTLAWIADRYPSAEVLYDGSVYHHNVLIVPEWVAHEYRDALPEDNGNPYQIIPPCAGGSLAEVLIEFYDGMV